MPKIVTPLSDTKIKNLKVKDKDYKISDGKGLFLVVKKNLTKFWRFDFIFEGKRKSMSFGIYPTVTLKSARDMREKANENIAQNINPIESRDSNYEIRNTFESIGNRWLEQMKGSWSQSNYEKIKSNLENNAYPFFKNKDIKDLTRNDILILVERMEKRNAIEYGSRLLNNIQRIYKYAVTKEFVEHNIIADIDKQNTLKKRTKKNIPAITNKNEIAELMNDIKNYGNLFRADISTIYALKLAPFVVLRPYNLRFLEWQEICFDKNIIEISAEKMKMRESFVMPLSIQALEIIKEVEQFKNGSKYLFYSSSSKSKCISENTLNHALHKMGYKNIHTAHGFRSTFSTNAHENISEHGSHSDIIESCLAHAQTNSVKKAYNRESKYKYLDDKRKLMQWWGNWLDYNSIQSKKN